MSDWIWDSVPDSVWDSVSYSIRDWISNFCSNIILDWIPDSVPDSVSYSIPDLVSDSNPKSKLIAVCGFKLLFADCSFQVAVCSLFVPAKNVNSSSWNIMQS